MTSLIPPYSLDAREAFQERKDDFVLRDTVYLSRIVKCDLSGPFSRDDKFRWPVLGYVESPDWVPEGYGAGLYGSLNGSSSHNYLVKWAIEEPKKYFLQIVLTNKDELVRDISCRVSDKLAGSFKFRRGIVVQTGYVFDTIPFLLMLVRQNIISKHGLCEYVRFCDLPTSYLFRYYGGME